MFAPNQVKNTGRDMNHTFSRERFLVMLKNDTSSSRSELIATSFLCVCVCVRACGDKYYHFHKGKKAHLTLKERRK